ncbi:MAG: peptide chain release factor N(5)-glutamine methyltransferase [Bacteroidia bacterium]
MQKLTTIRDIYRKELTNEYGEREAQQLFLTACLRIDNKGLSHVILGEETANKQLYFSCLEAISQGLPIQYFFGLADFDGMLLKVNEEVLIPRPETEELVHWVSESLVDKKSTVLDMCTGSACIALALKRRHPDTEMIASDVSQAALAIAQENAKLYKLELKFICSDALKDDIPQCDIIVCNPPYIPLGEKGSMAKQVVDHEPEIALFVPDHKALIFYERIAETVKERGIEAFVEIHEDLKVELEEMLHKFGVQFTFRKDMQEKWRMLHMKT